MSELEYAPTLYLSDSLYNLLHEHRDKSRPLRILFFALQRQKSRRQIKMRGKNYGFWRLPRQRTLLLNPDPPGNYFTFREDRGMISYCPKGKKQELTVSGKWARKNRVAQKPASMLRKLLNPKVIKKLKITADELAVFATIVRHEELQGDLEFKIVPFSEGYKMKNYRDGNTFGSCMWNYPVENFYEAWGAQCLVCVDGLGEFRARAVLWPKVQMTSPFTKEVTVMDRVYADTEEVRMAMRAHAKAEGWVYKERDSHSDKQAVRIGGVFYNAIMKLSSPDGKRPVVKFYPYLDTFTWGFHGELFNYQPPKYTDVYGTTGGAPGPGNIIIDVDGAELIAKEAVSISGCWYRRTDSRVRQVSNGNWFLAEETEELDGRWYRSAEVVFSNVENRRIPYEESVTVGGYIYHRNNPLIVSTYDHGYCLRADCCQPKGERQWWPKNHQEICWAEDGVWAFRSQCRTIGGKRYLRDSKLIYINNAGYWRVKPKSEVVGGVEIPISDPAPVDHPKLDLDDLYKEILKYSPIYATSTTIHRADDVTF